MTGRTKSRGLVYLRRSTTRQEISLAQQLEWAIRKAQEHGVQLDAGIDDLVVISKTKQNCKGAIFLDDGITGADLERPGLSQFIAEAISRKEVSHVFVHDPDRFARPEDPLEAVKLQQQLQRAGITVVFSNQIAGPISKGQSCTGESILALINYSESGQFLQKLALRITETKLSLAKGGFWTGGRPPYGFVRVLVDASGNEILELEEGTRIRREGCHVRIKPRDQGKINDWIRILKWYHNEKRGIKWIAAELNRLGIPSPDAGRKRTDAAGRHMVSGSWSHRTVQHLIKNPAIIGILRYGTKSEGAHRRHGPSGARLLEESDTRADGSPKTILNSPESFIEHPAGYDGLIDKDFFDQCQKIAEERGRSQRGVSRTRDLARYPLAMRVFDMTDGCGHPMYARTSGNRSLYVCGRYLKSGGAECEHNSVDGGALTDFIVNLLYQLVSRCGGRAALKKELEKLAFQEAEKSPTREIQRQTHLERELKSSQEELRQIEENLARAPNEKTFNIILAKHEDQEKRIRKLKVELEHENATANRAKDFDPSAEVDRALALFDRLDVIESDRTARMNLRETIDEIDMKIGLYFKDGLKGTKRKIRVLKSGIVVTGGQLLPVRPYGKDYIAPANLGCEEQTVSVKRPDRSKSAEERIPSEGVSFTKVIRGD
ncbi:MAG: hypothetical protein AMXMBFR20_26040 [Planctomycetia bacterium]